MERSIESIWKEGFITSESLAVPKLTSIYNQKSMHIVERFKRTGKRNLYGIAIGAILFFGLTILLNIAHIGAFIGLMMAYLIWVGRRQARYLEEINYGSSSYEYLKAFNDWLKNAIEEYGRIYRYLYPILFLAFILATLYAELLGQQSIISKIMSDPDTYLIQGLPIFWILPIMLFIVLVFFFSGALYRFDLYSVYGGIFKKLDELMKDMEELRREP